MRPSILPCSASQPISPCFQGKQGDRGTRMSLFFLLPFSVLAQGRFMEKEERENKILEEYQTRSQRWNSHYYYCFYQPQIRTPISTAKCRRSYRHSRSRIYTHFWTTVQPTIQPFSSRLARLMCRERKSRRGNEFRDIYTRLKKWGQGDSKIRKSSKQYTLLHIHGVHLFSACS